MNACRRPYNLHSLLCCRHAQLWIVSRDEETSLFERAEREWELIAVSCDGDECSLVTRLRRRRAEDHDDDVTNSGQLVSDEAVLDSSPLYAREAVDPRERARVCTTTYRCDKLNVSCHSTPVGRSWYPALGEDFLPSRPGKKTPIHWFYYIKLQPNNPY